MRLKVLYLCLLALALVGVAGFALYRIDPQGKLGANKISFNKPGSKEVSAATATPRTDVTMFAAGDIMLSRSVERCIETHDRNYPFAGTKDAIRSADLAFANLENPITTGPEVPSGSFTFHAFPGAEKSLADAGFDIMNLANNHTPNYGQQGLLDTFNYLNSVGVKYVGAGKDANQANSATYLEKNGIKFAFLGFNDADVVPPTYFATATSAGTNKMDIPKLINDVKTAKQNADIVIVTMHSGIEYSVPNQHQIDFARAAIDAGADIVIGAHPHVLQKVENYHGKYILYSLGNFIFDQTFSYQTTHSAFATIDFDKSGVKSLKFTAIDITDGCQPKIISDPTAAAKALGPLDFTPM